MIDEAKGVPVEKVGGPMRATLMRLAVLLFACAGLVAGGSVWCQSYPTKPVRLILGGLPAGGADVILRPIAQ